MGGSRSGATAPHPIVCLLGADKPVPRHPACRKPPTVLMVILLTVTLFLSSTLLFLVQPMIGKMVLPLLGGTPAVWNTCMVFFLMTLLAGYLYVHAATTWLRP